MYVAVPSLVPGKANCYSGCFGDKGGSEHATPKCANLEQGNRETADTVELSVPSTPA